MKESWALPIPLFLVILYKVSKPKGTLWIILEPIEIYNVELIYIKIDSLACWLLRITEARILLGNRDLQAVFFCLSAWNKLNNERILSLFLLSYLLWPGDNISDRLPTFQNHPDSLLFVVVHHLHGNEEKHATLNAGVRGNQHMGIHPWSCMHFFQILVLTKYNLVPFLQAGK